MARIPQKFIDDLLDRIDIVDVVDRRVKLRKTGKNFSACCPFHDEKTPSFSVNPEKQFYYCFGCGAGGNAIGFIMDYERMDFPEAVESMAQSAGLEVPREQSRPGDPPPQESNKPLYEQLEAAARFYELALRKHGDAKRAVTYLKGRGLTGQIAKAFRVGFAPPGWDNLMSDAGDNEKAQSLLMEGGMLVKNDKGRTYDRFRDRIMFPILDARGRVIAFGGRVLGDDKPKYLNSPETPVFHKSRELYGLYQARKNNRSLDRIVVVEGYMDVIALAQNGIGYAVATLGTATSETHLERLFRHVTEVVFCFDGDEAGRKAAFRGLEAALPAMQDGRQAKFLFLPDGEDPDTLVRAKGKAHLEHLFDTAPPLETFLFNQLAEGLDLNALDGRARFSKIAAPYVHKLPEGVFKTLMYQELANRTGIDVGSLKRLQPPPEPRREESDSNASRRGDGGRPNRGDGPSSPSGSTAGGDYDPYANTSASSRGGFKDGNNGGYNSAQNMPSNGPNDYASAHYGPDGVGDPGEPFTTSGMPDYPDANYGNQADAYSEGYSEGHPESGFPGSPHAHSDEHYEAPDNTLAPSPTNPIHRLLGLLVLSPALGSGKDQSQLPEGTSKDAELLRALVERVTQQPDISTAAILGYWFGTPEGQLLAELAGREPLEDDAGREALFDALLEQIAQKQQLSGIRARYDALKSADYGALTREEKRELLELAGQIRALSGRS